jgi:hypothetical protein
MCCDPSFWSETDGSYLLYTDDFVVYLLEGHSEVLCRSISREMPDNGFTRFIRLCVKCRDVEILLSEEFLYDIVVHHTFVVIQVPAAVLRKISPLATLLFLSGD